MLNLSYRVCFCAFLLVSFVSAQGSVPPEYQQNSSAIALTVNGKSGDAFSPASDLVWVGGQASLHLEVGSYVGNVTILALDPEGVKSRSQGALVTQGGQIINLALGASLVTVDVTGSLSGGSVSVAIPTLAPGYFAFQALVTDPYHVDGFRLSAPAVLSVAYASGSYLSGYVNCNTLQSSALVVRDSFGVAFANDYCDEELPVTSVSGCVTLTTQSLGVVQHEFTIDVASKIMRVGTISAATLWDIFPFSFSESGVLEFQFDSPVEMSVGSVFLAPPIGMSYKTDKGYWVATPVNPLGSPQLTAAQADAALAGAIPQISARVQRVGNPDNRTWCHGHTFLPPGATANPNVGGVSGRDVARILADNNYKPCSSPMPPRVGDVAVYRRADGKITHTGKITQTSGGNPSQISSRWGHYGVFLHAPEDVPPTYGITVEYWHTDRLLDNELVDP